MENLDIAMVRNVLTLRYNPQPQNVIPNLTWNDFMPETKPSEAQTEAMLEAVISKYVEANKPKQISIGLSSGVDATLIMLLFRKLYPELKIMCISIGFGSSNDEVKDAQEFARNNNCDFTGIYLDNFLSSLPLQISMIREPKWNYYYYYLAKEAKKNGSIFVTGDGADEIFGGYTFRYQKFLQLVKEGDSPLQKTMAYLECHSRDWVTDQDQMFGKKIGFSWDGIYGQLKAHFDNSLPAISQVFLADYHGKLTNDWIPCFSKIDGHLKIKKFSPFLDHGVIKFGSGISLEKKYDQKNNRGKLLLREIARKNGQVISDSKKGFGPALDQFWQKYGKRMAKQHLANSHVVKDGLVNSRWVESAMSLADKDIRYVNKVLSVLSLEVWYQMFVLDKMSKDDVL